MCCKTTQNYNGLTTAAGIDICIADADKDKFVPKNFNAPYAGYKYDCSKPVHCPSCFMPNEKTATGKSANESKIQESKAEAKTKLEIELISGIVILIILVILAVCICHKKR